MAAQLTCTKGPRARGEQRVDGAGDQLLAGAGFAGDEDGGVGGRDLFDAFQHAAQGGRVADDLLKPGRLAELGLEGDVFRLDLLAQLADLFVGEGVGDGHGDGAGDGGEHLQLVGCEGVRLDAGEYRRADQFAAHQQRDRRIRPDARSRQMKLVVIPGRPFQEVIAGIRNPGLQDAFGSSGVIVEPRP